MKRILALALALVMAMPIVLANPETGSATIDPGATKELTWITVSDIASTLYGGLHSFIKHTETKWVKMGGINIWQSQAITYKEPFTLYALVPANPLPGDWGTLYGATLFEDTESVIAEPSTTNHVYVTNTYNYDIETTPMVEESKQTGDFGSCESAEPCYVLSSKAECGTGIYDGKMNGGIGGLVVKCKKDTAWTLFLDRNLNGVIDAGTDDVAVALNTNINNYGGYDWIKFTSSGSGGPGEIVNYLTHMNAIMTQYGLKGSASYQGSGVMLLAPGSYNVYAIY